MSNQPGPAVAAIPDYLAGTWKGDLEHSQIAFSVRQLGTKVHGRFTLVDLTIVTADNPADSSVRATVDVASITTGNPKRDEHVRSATFLQVAEYPTADYHSTNVRHDGAGWVIDGDLTLHGLTRNVPIHLAVAGFVPGLNGGGRATFSATALVDRTEFGIDRWSGGGLIVGNKVPLAFEIAAVRQS